MIRYPAVALPLRSSARNKGLTFAPVSVIIWSRAGDRIQMSVSMSQKVTAR